MQSRQLAGIKALEFCWGGISKVGKLTGRDYKTIKKRMTKVENGNYTIKTQKTKNQNLFCGGPFAPHMPNDSVLT